MRRHPVAWSLLALGLAGFVLLAALYDQDPFASLDEEVATPRACPRG